ASHAAIGSGRAPEPAPQNTMARAVTGSGHRGSTLGERLGAGRASGVAHLRAERAEQGVEAVAQQGGAGDDRDGDEGRDEAVLDGGGALLVLDELLDHDSLLGGCGLGWNARPGFATRTRMFTRSGSRGKPLRRKSFFALEKIRYTARDRPKNFFTHGS